MKNILVIGFGLSGRSASQFLLSQGVNIIAVDDKYEEILELSAVKELIERGVKLIRSDNLPDLSQFDYAVCSPGVSPTHPLIHLLNAAGIEIMSEAELGLKYLKAPILGVSGTNGKTTVTLMTAHILNVCGKRAFALGNVGIPLTSAIDKLKMHEIVVAELSSYQLEGLKGSLLDASVLLNITPDHLDRYHTMENYARAKLQLQNITKDRSRFFMEKKTYSAYGPLLKNPEVSCYGYDPSLKLFTDLKAVFIEGKYIGDLPEPLQNKKSHDVENYLAAFALSWSMGCSANMIPFAYKTFNKPHHRIEFIKEIAGIKFFDDSKGTNIDAVIRAVEAMDGQIHLLAGGVDKGASYAQWIPFFKGKVKKIYTIGQAAEKIFQDLSASIEVEFYQDLEKAVNAAYRNAESGENVLLSPGCSSFDMFKDYIDRGISFQKIVFSINPVDF